MGVEAGSLCSRIVDRVDVAAAAAAFRVDDEVVEDAVSLPRAKLVDEDAEDASLGSEILA